VQSYKGPKNVQSYKGPKKCAVIQRTFGPKVLYTKWSKGPSSGHFYAAATETLSLA